MSAKKKTKPFHERIKKYPARLIADAIGCALPTAFDWRSGRRKPPAYLQDRYIRDIDGFMATNHVDYK